MTSRKAVHKAVIERIRNTRDGVGYFWYRPVPIPGPAAVVVDDYPPATLEQGFSSTSAERKLVIMLVSDQFDEERAEEDLSEWADPDGPMVSALLDFDEQFDDALSAMTRDVDVTMFGAIKLMDSAGVTQYYLPVKVTIRL